MANTLITDRRSSPAIYKTIRRLGKGGMAEVFLARQEGVAGFRRLAVVKRLLPQFSTLTNVAEMLLDEARIAAQLNHPNIVQIYELGEEDGQYFIAMEYVDGCDLATLARIERRRKSRVPLRLALRVLSEAAMGLDYAHRQVGLDGRPLNLVHRDVSPHNVLCSREGAVKVTDFGIAKAVGKVQVTEVGVVKGKVHYMSPEQYTGAEVDKRSDVFSLGVVLYQLTTGRLPRVSKNGEVNMRQVTEGRIPHPMEIRPDYPEELDAITMRALAQDPDDRYQDSASLRDDLLEFARQHDLLAFPKELADYVNALVPRQPIFNEEETKTPDPLSGDGRAPLVSVPSETAGPPLTERVEHVQSLTSVGRKTAASRSGLGPVSDPFEEHTDIPIDAAHVVKRKDAAILRPTARLVDQVTPSSGRRVVSGSDDHGRYERVHDSQVEDEIDLESRGNRASQESRSLRPLSNGVRDALARDRNAEARSDMTLIKRLVLGSRMSWLGASLAVVLLIVVAVVLLFLLVERRAYQADANLAPLSNSLVRPTAGEIDVMSVPAKAAVFVDGAQRCENTPCQVRGLPLGRELVVTARGDSKYDLWVQRVVLTPEAPRLLLKAMLSKSSPATRSSRREQSTGGVSKASGSSTSGATAADRRAGGRSVTSTSHGSSASGARAASDSAPRRHIRGKKGTGNLVVERIAQPIALLAVDVRPGWAAIWIDGKQVGHTPRQLPIAPGHHVVELKNPERNFHAVYRLRAKKGTKTKITDKIAQPTQPTTEQSS